MMYSPNHYQENRTELIYQILRDYGFATLITQNSEGLMISHLPLLLELIDGQPFLLGHCAKVNSQWRELAQGQKVTAIFHGPHSYISPAWYQPKPDNVPTWNYVAVHVQGTATLISEPSEVYSLLQKTTDQFEAIYATGWSLPPEANEDLSKLSRFIVAFKISVSDIQAKFKLSQKQEPVSRNNVIQNLSKMGSEQKSVARLMDLVLESGGKQSL